MRSRTQQRIFVLDQEGYGLRERRIARPPPLRYGAPCPEFQQSH